jgi:hypothetical protein
MTCEEFLVVYEKNPFHATRAERTAFRNHAKQCDSCRTIMLDAAKEIWGSLSPNERQIILDKALPPLKNLYDQDTSDPECQ